MAFWSKKKLVDSLSKYFKDKKVTVEIKDNLINFDLNMPSGYTLYPYVKLDDEINSMSIVINVRKQHKNDGDLIHKKLTEFNVISKYFVAKLSVEGAIYLEYNAIVDSDNVADIFERVITSVTLLDNVIDNI